MENYQKALELLKKYKQEKILKQLEKYKSEELVNQVLSINFKQIEDLKKEIGKEKQYQDDIIEQISCVDTEDLSKEEKENYESIGKDIISKGKYAVVTMAGGQRNKTWA